MSVLNNPSKLWFLSTRLHAEGRVRLARIIKMYIFVTFRSVLPPEARLSAPVALGHYGMNIVVHPNVVIGHNVRLWHGVTLSVSDSPGSSTSIELEDNVEIGANAVVITRLRTSLVIVANCRVGANAVVTDSAELPGTYVGIPARRVGRLGEEQ